MEKVGSAVVSVYLVANFQDTKKQNHHSVGNVVRVKAKVRKSLNARSIYTDSFWIIAVPSTQWKMASFIQV